MQASEQDLLELIQIAQIRLPAEGSLYEKLERIRFRVKINPEETLDELRTLRSEADKVLLMSDPKQHYGRCVTVRSFLKYCVAPEKRVEYDSEEDYVSMLKGKSAPGQRAFDDMVSGVAMDERRILFPSDRSWIAPLHRLLDRSAIELKQELQLPFHYSPPFLLLRLPRDRMLEYGCKVRAPIGIDAAATENAQWKPADADGVLGERIDGPLCRGVVEGVEWKP